MARRTLLAVLLAVLCQSICFGTARQLSSVFTQRTLLDVGLDGCIWEDGCFLGSEYLANYVQSANASKSDDPLKTYVSYALLCSSILSNDKCSQADYCTWDASSPTPSYGCSLQESFLNQLQQQCVAQPYQTLLAVLQSCRSALLHCTKDLRFQQAAAAAPALSPPAGRRLAQAPAPPATPSSNSSATGTQAAGCTSVVSCMLTSLVGGRLNVAGVMEAFSAQVLPQLEALQFTTLGDPIPTARAETRRSGRGLLVVAGPLPPSAPRAAAPAVPTPAEHGAHKDHKDSADLAAALMADAAAFLPLQAPLPLLPLPLPLADPLALAPLLLPGSDDASAPTSSDPTHPHTPHAEPTAATAGGDATDQATTALSRTLLKLLQDSTSPHEWVTYYQRLYQAPPATPRPLPDAPLPHPTLYAPVRETLAADPPPSTTNTSTPAAPAPADPPTNATAPAPPADPIPLAAPAPLQGQLKDPTSAAKLLAAEAARVSSAVAGAAAGPGLPPGTRALLTNVSLDLSLLSGYIAGRAANNAGTDPLLVVDGTARKVHEAAQRLLCGLPGDAAARAPLLQVLGLELTTLQAHWLQLLALAPGSSSGWGASHAVSLLAGALGYMGDLEGVCEAAPPAVPGFGGSRLPASEGYGAAVAQAVVLLTDAATSAMPPTARQAATAWMPDVTRHLTTATQRAVLLATLAEARPSGEDALDNLLTSVPDLAASVPDLQQVLQPACAVLLAASRQARRLVNWRATSARIPAAGSAAATGQLVTLATAMEGLVNVLGSCVAAAVDSRSSALAKGLGMQVAVQARMCAQGRTTACGQMTKLAGTLAQSDSLTPSEQKVVAQLLLSAAQMAANCSSLTAATCATAPSCALAPAAAPSLWTPPEQGLQWAGTWGGGSCRADLEYSAQMAAKWEAQVEGWAAHPSCSLLLRAVPACDALPATDTCSQTPFCAPYSWESDGPNPNLRRAALLKPPTAAAAAGTDPGMHSACLPNWDRALQLLLGQSAVDRLAGTAKKCAAQPTAAACDPDSPTTAGPSGSPGSVTLVNGQQRSGPAGQASNFLSQYWPHIVGVVGGALFALLAALAVHRWQRARRDPTSILAAIAAPASSRRSRSRKSSKRHRRRGSSLPRPRDSAANPSGTPTASAPSTTPSAPSTSTAARSGSATSTTNLLTEPAQAYRVYEIPSLPSNVSLPGYSYARPPPGTPGAGPSTSAAAARPPIPPHGPPRSGAGPSTSSGAGPSTSAAGGYGYGYGFSGYSTGAGPSTSSAPGGPDLMRFSNSFEGAPGGGLGQQGSLPTTNSYSSFTDADRVALALALSQQDSNPYPSSSTNFYPTGSSAGYYYPSNSYLTAPRT